MEALLEELQGYSTRKIFTAKERFDYEILLFKLLCRVRALPAQPELQPLSTFEE